MRNEYDEDLYLLRLELASKSQLWYVSEKKRERIIFFMIISFIFWIMIFSLLMILVYNVNNYAVISFIGVGFWLAPGYLFIRKINKITKTIDFEKENLILDIFKNKTQDIHQIELQSGIDKNFINYYLKKNGLL